MEYFELIWSESKLIVIGPPLDKLTRALEYREKMLVWDQASRKRVVRSQKCSVYTILQESKSIRILETFQGLLDRCVDVIKKEGYTYRVNDKRKPFPEPILERAGGFRFNQEEVFKDILSKNRSGNLKAITRWGKSVIATNLINVYPGVKTVLLAPGIDLLEQHLKAVKKHCPDREVTGLFTGQKTKNQSEDVTVCSFDSMDKLDFEKTKLVIVDEPHAAVTESRAPQLARFANARIIGTGATTEGRWSGNDILIEGLIGPVLREVTYSDAVKLGAICPIKVFMVKVPFEPFKVSRRDTAYKKLVWENKNFAELVGNICNKVIPKYWQTLIFINNEKQARLFNDNIDESEIAMDKLMKNKTERKQMFDDLESGTVNRCVCSNIYSTGVTIDGIRAVVNCDGGGAGILSVQKPGRLAEIKPGKKYGYMIDFIFEDLGESDGNPAWKMIVNDSWSRYKAYLKKGYELEIVDDYERIKEKLE